MIKTSTIDGVTIASFEGINRIVATNSEEIKKELNHLLDISGSKFIVNMEHINYIDSTGFGTFISLLRTATHKKATLKLCNLYPDVKKLFVVLHLDSVFELFDNLDVCVQSFN